MKDCQPTENQSRDNHVIRTASVFMAKALDRVSAVNNASDIGSQTTCHYNKVTFD